MHTMGQTLGPDSITVAVGPRYDQVSALHRLFLGSHHRKEWAAPVRLRVLRLSDERGGLKVAQLGGGMQTRSLRLRDGSGHEWVLRTIQKYPDRKLPDYLKKTLASDILQDQVSSIHPFSALVVPPLAQALGLPHANPEIVYLADDPALGQYRQEFANQVYLFEERTPLEADKTYNTDKVQEKLRDDNDNRVDRHLVLRARLLDMLLGDWDRHEDQWRWERVRQEHGDIYKPIPRDRDQVFYKTNGIFPWFVSHQWLRSKFQGYSGRIRDIRGWNLQAQTFDRYFLTGLDEAAWREEIALVQNTLTDDLLRKAMHRMPDTVYQISGQQILADLIARRDILPEQALEYYRFISKEVDILGTDKHELFVAENEPGGLLKVSVYKVSAEGAVRQSTYERHFDPAITKEVRLYGFDHTDRFDLTRAAASPIIVRVIAGLGADTVLVAERSRKHDVHIYDLKNQPDQFPSRSRSTWHLSRDFTVNAFDRSAFRYDRFAIVTQANYGVDKGISLIGGISSEKHGFRKDPYRKRHELLGEYSLARKSLAFTYKGDFIKLLGENSVQVNVRSRGPNNVANFFGYGNESTFINEGDKKILYYRNRYDFVLADVSLYRIAGPWRVSAGLAGQYYTAGRNNNTEKFLGAFAAQNPAERIFTDKAYAGFLLNATLDTRGKNMVRTRGIYWNTTIAGYTGIVKSKRQFLQLATEFGFLFNPDRDSVLVISNRTGLAASLGEPEFYQRVRLGGLANLRGFHTGRFTGSTMAYNDLEARVKLFDFNSYLLPGSVGIVGFNDLGRVWMPGERSARLHVGYGGGLYIVPAHSLLIEGMVGLSQEGAIPYISLGLKF